jgi:hypothetical protein
MNLGHGYALNANVGDGLPNLIDFERLDDSGNELHAFIPACAV